VSNRGIGRARLFFGTVILLAAVIAWAIAFMMSPHGDTVVRGTEHVRPSVAAFMSKSGIGTLLLAALAGWLLFPARRPKKPWRDWAIAAVLAVLVLSSLYQLVWVNFVL
jgi:drug/metabolite transporter (DMT)-like permease